MKRSDLVNWLDTYLDIASYPDISLNGLQVEGSEEITKIAVAVDSSLTTIEQAVGLGAQFLIVHHGLFWGQPKAITGAHGKRVRTLFEGDLSLYAAHIPLDAHKEVGNNWGLARMLGLTGMEDFGTFKGRPVGVKGNLPQMLERRELAQMVEAQLGEPVMLLEGGPKEVRTLGIISGGAAWDVLTAADEGLDAFLTGEPRHDAFYEAYENNVNALFGGHYMTETIGVNRLGEKLQQEFDLPVHFIYLPTGL
jgi:dinuclear metal center YbgI/SA1388 family protein